MTADVIKSFYTAGIAANDDDTFARDLAQEVIARVGNAIGASGADPTFEKEVLDFLTEERGVRIVARRQCFRNGAQGCLLRSWNHAALNGKPAAAGRARAV